MHITWLSSVMLWYGRCLDKKPYAQQTNTQFVKSECKKMNEKKSRIQKMESAHFENATLDDYHQKRSIYLNILKKKYDDGACNANP